MSFGSHVLQTRFGDPGGNCFQAAVASVFGFDQDNFEEEVPDFAQIGDPLDETDHSWWHAFEEWTVERFGVFPVPIPGGLKVRPLGPYIVTGKTEIGSYHAQVWEGDEFEWDPSGTRADLEVEYRITWVTVERRKT